MTETKGKIKVNTGDIFPIIKKWLYSEHDIFLRELVANATDAISKRSTLGRSLNQEIPTGAIQVNVNKTNKTITITDNGLGMSKDEVEKYIAQLAFSGAEEFVQKMEKEGQKSSDIIGKFGLGFYSSFMVANKVVIDSLSMQDGSVATNWSCEGDTDYIFSESTKKEVGTTITLHINEENLDFLNEWTLMDTLKKFCDFMPYQISILDEERKPEKPKKADGSVDEEAKEVAPEARNVNDTNPLWKKNPTEVTEKEYLDFFRKIYPTEQNPLFWVHLKVDHPFTLEGILYFPKINTKMPTKENNIKLYSKQVFVSDNVKNIIPEFLSLLKGTIDSTDIPLNVSRSSLQGDPNIKKISNYIVKKVAEALKKLYKNDRSKYEDVWADSGLFVKYGCLSDTKFDELMRDMVIFKDENNKYATLNEVTERTPEKLKDKLKDKILYAEGSQVDPTLKAMLLEEKISYIQTDDHIDPHFIQHVETHAQKEITLKFSSVDSEIENLFEGDNSTPDDIKVKDLFSKFLLPPEVTDKDGNVTAPADKEISISKLKNTTTAAYIKIDEQMKRFAKMTESMGQMGSSFPLKKTLVVNPNNPLVINALKIHEKGGNEQVVDQLCHHIEDLALISTDNLDQDGKAAFITRSQKLMETLTGLAL